MSKITVRRSIYEGDRRNIPVDNMLAKGFQLDIKRYFRNENPVNNYSQFTYSLDILFFLAVSCGYERSPAGLEEYLAYLREHPISHYIGKDYEPGRKKKKYIQGGGSVS